MLEMEQEVPGSKTIRISSSEMWNTGESCRIKLRPIWYRHSPVDVATVRPGVYCPLYSPANNNNVVCSVTDGRRGRPHDGPQTPDCRSWNAHDCVAINSCRITLALLSADILNQQPDIKKTPTLLTPPVVQGPAAPEVMYAQRTILSFKASYILQRRPSSYHVDEYEARHELVNHKEKKITRSKGSTEERAGKDIADNRCSDRMTDRPFSSSTAALKGGGITSQVIAVRLRLNPPWPQPLLIQIQQWAPQCWKDIAESIQTPAAVSRAEIGAASVSKDDVKPPRYKLVHCTSSDRLQSNSDKLY
ncbi:hypothetical protein DAPPUDRAFT_237497 [Daphnia pulex]|uniref:Uncharacterized protein n=1 Tax=Daphnia pulex TaxID=6669 RepID=E9G404_DAPPU|nr:hypothetical protein DAPPUDRAFT_237497 [Daphnia pulex]|eukprot:EFX85861.1 hypothetical protein DAPPUDRAFT_237497 [Daphnia pulex]